MLLSRRIMMSQKPFRMLVAILCTEILKRILNASVAQSASCQNPPDPISAAIFYFPEGEIPVHSSPPPVGTQTRNQRKRKTNTNGKPLQVGVGEWRSESTLLELDEPGTVSKQTFSSESKGHLLNDSVNDWPKIHYMNTTLNIVYST